eukprot:gene25586-19272_t
MPNSPMDIELLLKSMPNVKVLKLNHQMKAVMTIIRNKATNREDFKFYADRIVRFVVEEGLAEVP